MLTVKTTLFYLRHIFEVVVTPHGKLVSFGNVGTICTIEPVTLLKVTLCHGYF